MSRYMILVASLGRYRQRTMQAVQRALGSDLLIAAGTVPYDKSVKVLTSDDIAMQEVPNLYGPVGLLWQWFPWRQALKAETLVADLNPRVLSGWALLLLRRMLRRRTLLWGHAFPRSGRGAPSDRVRGWMRSLADGMVCYTQTQANELRALHGTPVYTAPNALYLREEIGFSRNIARHAAVYVGRIEPSKKVALLLEGFGHAAARAPDLRLIIVGDGSELAAMRERAARLPCADRITFLGHVDELGALRGVYGQAFVSVSPGYVGLSITQSLAFGVPMLIARDENHSPEIEAASEGENSEFFESDDSASLAHGLLEFYRDRQKWHARGPEIAEACAREYSVEAMADGIVAAIVGR
jgi:glycosyltransferase involved in cell wall biosynthesis